MIEGVYVEKLETHLDERGFFREVVRASVFSMGIAQVSHSLMYQGVIKAWHKHVYQWDLLYVVNGVLKVVLWDGREGSETYKELNEFMFGDNQEARTIIIPTGVWHGCKCLSGPCNLIYATTKEYDPWDELRMPHYDHLIGYDWLKQDIT